MTKNKQKIIQYFEDNHGKYFTAADLEEELDIDFCECDMICEELVQAGEIK